MAKFNYNLRSPGKLTNCPIYLIIRYQNEKLTYPTGETIPPEFWETDINKSNFQRAKRSKQFPEYPEFNARLDYIQIEAKNIYRRYLNDNDNRPPSIEELRELLNEKFKKTINLKNINLFQFIERFINEAGSRTNDHTQNPIARSTKQAYKNAFRLLTEFKEHRRKNFDFNTIDLDFYYEYVEYLKEEQQFSVNTIGKHVKMLKSILNDATERGYNTNLAYKSRKFKAPSEEFDSAIYLTAKELDEMYSFDLSDNSRLEKVRDLFIVGCWTGLRYSDFSQIKSENVKGDKYFEIKTQKTGEKVVIPLHPVVKEIMIKYKDVYDNSLPPAISNAKTNRYLKEIALLLPSLQTEVPVSKSKGGLVITVKHKRHELVTTHTARRSFATNLYLDDFPSISIMKITGHRTEKAFLSYIKITPNENAKKLAIHWKSSLSS